MQVHTLIGETHNTFLPDTGASVLEWDWYLISLTRTSCSNKRYPICPSTFGDRFDSCYAVYVIALECLDATFRLLVPERVLSNNYSCSFIRWLHDAKAKIKMMADPPEAVSPFKEGAYSGDFLIPIPSWTAGYNPLLVQNPINTCSMASTSSTTPAAGPTHVQALNNW